MYNEFLQELVQLNFLPLGIVLFLVIFLQFNHTYEARLTRQFTVPLAFLVWLVIVDNIDYYLINDNSTSLVRVAISFLGYNIRIFLMYSLKLIAARITSRRERLLTVIPAILNLCITSLAFFTKLVFWYAPDASIMRGPLAYTPHVISLVYSLLLFWHAYRLRQQGKAQEGIIISVAVVLCLAGTFVEMAFQLRGILIGVIAMNVTFYYLYIHIEYFKVDILTGTLNRLSFYADIEMYKQKKTSVYILSVDLNGLKQINDNEGHAAGDLLLKKAANLLNEVFGQYEIYRAGGDEFVVITPNCPKDLFEKKVGELRPKSSYGSEVCLAIGSHWDKQGDNLRLSMHFADEAMYADKNNFYISHPENVRRT